MKKTLLSALTIITISASAQNVIFTDPNLKSFLVNYSNVNTNGDTEIQLTEAAAYNMPLVVKFHKVVV